MSRGVNTQKTQSTARRGWEQTREHHAESRTDLWLCEHLSGQATVFIFPPAPAPHFLACVGAVYLFSLP